jgi:hypothetical protein
VDFGLQKGRGSNYETVQKYRSTGNDLSFEFSVEAVSNGRDSLPVLRGPFVHGPPHERFLYVDIGTYAGQAGSSWSRRLKIPLSGITSDVIERMAEHPLAVLEARVPGTSKDGGPNCATVKPFDGWRLARSRGASAARAKSAIKTD